MVECAEVDYEGEVFHLIITLDPKGLVRNVNALTMQSSISRFSNWWIGASDLKYMERYLKPVSTFLYDKY